MNIFDEYEPEVINKIIKRNRILKENCPDMNPYALIIFDDVIDDSTLRNDETIKGIFTRGRHECIGILFLTQYLKALSPTCRNNCDIVICCIQNSNEAIDILYNSYGIIKKWKFIELLNDYTQDYSVFIIRNDSSSNDYRIKYQYDNAKN